AVTLVTASVVASRNAAAAIQTGLEQTNARVFDILVGQRTTMLKLAQQYAYNPDFRSALGRAQHASDTSSAFASLFDLTTEADTAVDATRTQIVGSDGTLLARSDDAAAHGTPLGGALVGGALEGHQTQGFGVVDSVLAQVVAVPIPGAGGSLLGALMALRKIDDTLATRIGRQTGSELVFYTIIDGHPKVSVSSPKLGGPAALSSTIESAMTSPKEPVARPTSGSALMSIGDQREIEIGGEHYVGQRVAALSAGGTEVGGFIALRDKDVELASYYKLRTALLLAGAGGLLLAVALSLGIARQIVRPVQALVGATQRATEGDYNAEIPISGNDEIGILAGAFKRLLADLHDKQALVDFLQGTSSGRTVPIHAEMPTRPMQAAAGVTTFEPGQTLAVRYEIKAVLGVGGMGMVYKASDRELGEFVAIKTLKSDLMEQDPTALDRFKSEIKLARRISHRNVVRTYDLGESSGVYFITMEFVEGKSLKDLIGSRGRLPVSVALPIAKQLCRALEVAHEEGVIHRDIKPQNMVVQPDGVLKVMDFGIARLARRGTNTGHTQVGVILGTPEYMAPEQLLGEEIDVRADLYAAGVVIYECLTGKLPHDAETTIALISKVLDETPRPPRELQPDIPKSLSDLVVRTLSKDREKRPKTAAELHALLDRI
ncbi:MAG TPA: protein kinase, partial [Gemmatimonadaceae bacterium]|nr:protein kinase [Gemmatimonadaceae bacterium]